MKNFYKIIPLTLALNTLLSFADSKAVAGAKEDFQTFKKEVSKSLEKIDGDIESLTEKAKDKKDSVKAEAAADAKKARAKIEAQVAELKNKSKESWVSAKKEISASVDSLSQKVKAALD